MDVASTNVLQAHKEVLCHELVWGKLPAKENGNVQPHKGSDGRLTA